PELARANYGEGADFESHAVWVLLGNGDGTLRRTTDLNVGENPHCNINGDIDGDGLLDVATVDEISNTISVLLGNGDGTFGSPNYRTGKGAESVASADLDGDGRLDLAVANNLLLQAGVGGAVSVLLGNG